MGFGRRLRRAFRRVGRVFESAGRSVGGMLGMGEDKTQQMLIERQNQLLEEQKKKTQQMLEAAKLKEEEDAKLAASVAGEQTNLTEGQEGAGNDFASSGTSDIDTDWLEGVIDDEIKEGVDKNIVI